MECGDKLRGLPDLDLKSTTIVNYRHRCSWPLLPTTPTPIIFCGFTSRLTQVPLLQLCIHHGWQQTNHAPSRATRRLESRLERLTRRMVLR